MSNKKEFIGILQDLLKEHELSIAKFAIKVDIPRTTINNWFSRNSSPKIEQLHKVANYFKVSVDFLTGYVDEFGNRVK